MMAEGRDRGFAHFQILTHSIVFGDISFGLVAHPFIDRALAGNRCLPRGLSASPGLFHLSPMLGSKPAQLCSALTLAEFVTRSFFEFGQICRLIASISLSFGAHFALGQMNPATAAAGARHLSALPFR
jgi:hypothetical protein